MRAAALLERIGDLLHNVRLGLAVLFSECRWLLRGDRARHCLVQQARAREEELRLKLGALTVVADPARERIEKELSLLRADADRLEAEHLRTQALWRANLRERFRNDFTE